MQDSDHSEELRVSALNVTVDREQPLVDSHHHLWLMSEERLKALESSREIGELEFMHYVLAGMRTRPRYLIDELAADLVAGHNVTATVYVEAAAMYRPTGPRPMRSIGEVEFANGVAAMAAAGQFGPANACAAIVGAVDLKLGAAAAEVLVAHIRAGNGRYRGIRQSPSPPRGADSLFRDPQFREGFNSLHTLGLSFDTFLSTAQLLPELTELARSFPETQIILNHAGSPPRIGDKRFTDWKRDLRALSACENVAVKLGGIRHHPAISPPFTDEQLAAEWKPYLEASIEMFGPSRCMFGTDYPSSAGIASYASIWNVFKMIVADASVNEQSELFSGTAKRTYRLP